jgi:hypothetical protein
MTCPGCGKTFEVGDARSEFDAYDEWAGDLTYDDAILSPYGEPEDPICASCAIDVTLENLSAGRAMQFSLETGHPPEEVPDDWSRTADGGVHNWT